MTDLTPPVEADDAPTDELVDDGRLLPVGAPIDPHEMDVPEYQYAWGITADPETGDPDHGEPAVDGA